MPTYEYQCSKCGVFEVSQRISDAALTKCPTCRRKVQRLISASNFAFKGSGWYVTDYARKGNGGTSGDSGGGDGGSSESKSESKSDSTTSSDTKPAKKAKSGSSSSEKSTS